MEFRFTFVVSGVDVNDESTVVTLMEHLDATLALAAGVKLLVISTDGPDAVSAARNAIQELHFRVPELKVVRLDRDLVGITEIAERTGRSRQNVTQWVTGERHSKVSPAFPLPEAVVGRARVWLWSEVNTWLRHLGLADDVAVPTRTEMADIDYILQRNDMTETFRRTPDPAQSAMPICVLWTGLLDWGHTSENVTYSTIPISVAARKPE